MKIYKVTAELLHYENGNVTVECLFVLAPDENIEEFIQQVYSIDHIIKDYQFEEIKNLIVSKSVTRSYAQPHTKNQN